MRLERIKIAGFKGLKLEERVAPFQLYLGPNGTGKTGRLQAVEFLLTGGVKGEGVRALPGRASGIMALATESDVEVDGDFVGTEALGGTVRRHVTGSTSKASASSTGTPPTYAALALDFGGFLALSRAKQKDAIFALVGGGAAWDQDKVAKYLADKVAAELRRDEDDAATVFESEIARVVSAWADVDQVRAKLDEDFQAWNREQKRTTAAVAALATQRADAPPSRPLAEFQQDYTERREELQAVESDLGAAKAHAQNFRARDSERSTLVEAVRGLDASLRDKWDPELEALGAEPTGPPDPDPELAALAEETNRAEAQADDATDRLREAMTARTSAADEKARLDALADDPACPTCLQALRAEDFDKVVERASQAVEAALDEVRRLDALAEAAGAELGTAEKAETARREKGEALARVLGEWSQAKARRDKCAEDGARTRSRLDVVQAEIGAIPTYDLETLEQRRDGLAERVRTLEAEREILESARAFDLQLEGARSAALDAGLRFRAVKAIRAWVGPSGIVGNMVREASGPLADRVNDLLGGDQAGRFRFVFFDGDREGFDFGFDAPTGFVSYRTLSGGQFARLAAAILAATTALPSSASSEGAPAVSGESGPEWRGLVLDNLQDVSEPDRSALVLDLALMVQAGQLDQVVAASSEPIDPAIGEDFDEVTITKFAP